MAKLMHTADEHVLLRPDGAHTQLTVIPNVPMYLRVETGSNPGPYNFMFKYQTNGDLNVNISLTDIFPDNKSYHIQRTHPDAIEVDIPVAVKEFRAHNFGGELFFSLESLKGCKIGL
jgi:hypothetical protein